MSRGGNRSLGTENNYVNFSILKISFCNLENFLPYVLKAEIVNVGIYRVLIDWHEKDDGKTDFQI